MTASKLDEPFGLLPEDTDLSKLVCAKCQKSFDGHFIVQALRKGELDEEAGAFTAQAGMMSICPTNVFMFGREVID